MPNYLKMPKKSQVLALLELGWSYRRIQGETGVRRETVSEYDKTRQANAAKTFPGSDPSPPPDSPDISRDEDPNPAKAFAGSGSKPAKTFPGSPPRSRFAAAVYRTAILEKLDVGLSLQRIWQDLVEEYGYGASYESVKRFVRTLAPTRRAVGVFHCAPGAEAQVDFFRGGLRPPARNRVDADHDKSADAGLGRLSRRRPRRDGDSRSFPRARDDRPDHGKKLSASAARQYHRRLRPWTVPPPWTPRTRPPRLGKRTERVSHTAHRRPRTQEKQTNTPRACARERNQTILSPPTAWPLFKRSSVAAFERSVTFMRRRFPVLIVVVGWITIVWAVLIVASNAVAAEPGPWLPSLVSALVVAAYGATLIKRDRRAVTFTWIGVAIFGAAVVLGGLVPLLVLAWGLLLGFAFYVRKHESELGAS